MTTSPGRTEINQPPVVGTIGCQRTEGREHPGYCLVTVHIDDRTRLTRLWVTPRSERR